MDRHCCRQVVIRTLYQIEFNNYNLNDINLDQLIAYAIDPNVTAMALDSEVFDCNEENYQYIKDLLNLCLNEQAKIDQIIKAHIENYTINRLNIVDRSIIRLAVGEMLQKLLPIDIIIDEALELTKEYSEIDDGRQVKFNNRLLDSISKEFKNE